MLSCSAGDSSGSSALVEASPPLVTNPRPNTRSYRAIECAEYCSASRKWRGVAAPFEQEEESEPAEGVRREGVAGAAAGVELLLLPFEESIGTAAAALFSLFASAAAAAAAEESSPLFSSPASATLTTLHFQQSWFWFCLSLT